MAQKQVSRGKRSKTSGKTRSARSPSAGWYVYVARCSDDSLYTGITNDLVKRFASHNAGKGARYTRSRLPVVLVWKRRVRDKSAALRLEISLKRMTRAGKLLLIAAKSR